MWKTIEEVENEKTGIVGELQERTCEETKTIHRKIVTPNTELLVSTVNEDGSVTTSDGEIWKAK